MISIMKHSKRYINENVAGMLNNVNWDGMANKFKGVATNLGQTVSGMFNKPPATQSSIPITSAPTTVTQPVNQPKNTWGQNFTSALTDPRAIAGMTSQMAGRSMMSMGQNRQPMRQPVPQQTHQSIDPQVLAKTKEDEIAKKKQMLANANRKTFG